MTAANLSFISTSEERPEISTDVAEHLSVDTWRRWPNGKHLHLLQMRISGKKNLKILKIRLFLKKTPLMDVRQHRLKYLRTVGRSM